MNDIAHITGFQFPKPADTHDDNTDLYDQGAANANSGYNSNNGAAYTNTVNSDGSRQTMNNNILMTNLANNIIQAPQIQANQAPISMSFGSFLLNPLAMFFPQQTDSASVPPQMQDVTLAQPADTATPQLNHYLTPSQSPMPQAFFTPYSGTPSPPTPTPGYDTRQQLSSLPHAIVAHTALTQENTATTSGKKRKGKDSSTPSTSIIRQGVSSLGSAFGVMATYINKSLLSGIPFHIADRAMKDSKQIYSRWWDQTVTYENDADERSRKGSTDDEYMDDGSEGGPPVKKRKTIVDDEYVRASSLSQSLAGNYSDANFEAVEKNWQIGKSEVVERELPVQVDSSIIGPPRRKASASKGEYDIFDSIGSMYGGDMFTSNAVEEEKYNTSGNASYSMPRDSRSGHYFNSTEEDERKLASLPTHAKNESGNNMNIGNNNLGHTLQAIKEIFDEKNRASEEQEIFQMSFKNPRDWVTKTIRSELVDALQSDQGDVTTKRFKSSLEVLTRFYKASGRDARVNPWGGGGGVGGPAGADLLEGSWLNICRPNYVECLGQNAENDFMYTLGRMSFDIFQPSNLICSVQSTHNTITMIGEREELPACVPSSLKEEVTMLCESRDGDSTSKRPFLRSYE